MSADKTSGRLYGIGVGPGDPELLTIKAVNILKVVPVVAYPAPESGNSSARTIAATYLRDDQREIEIRVPMRSGAVPMAPYDRGAAAIAAELDAGHDVAVLCEGDPLFFGSFMYLHDRLAGRYPVKVVPGVTSLTACAASAGLPLVGRNDDLLIVPATLDDASLEQRLSAASAIAIVKVGRHFGRVRSILDRLGLTSRSVLVAYASRAEETVQKVADVGADTAPYFSMILIPGRQSEDASANRSGRFRP